MSVGKHVLSQYPAEDLLDLSRRAVNDQLSQQRCALAALAASEAARFYGVPAAEVYGARDGGRCGRGAMRRGAVQARTVAIYILTTLFSIRRDEVGALYGVSYDLVKKAIRRVEEQRDEDPKLEELLGSVEWLLSLGARS